MCDVTCLLQVDTFCLNFTKEVICVMVGSVSAHTLVWVLQLSPNRRNSWFLTSSLRRWRSCRLCWRYPRCAAGVANLTWRGFGAWKANLWCLPDLFQLQRRGVAEGSSGHPHPRPRERGGQAQEEGGGLMPSTFLELQSEDGGSGGSGGSGAGGPLSAAVVYSGFLETGATLCFLLSSPEQNCIKPLSWIKIYI